MTLGFQLFTDREEKHGSYQNVTIRRFKANVCHVIEKLVLIITTVIKNPNVIVSHKEESRLH